MPKRRPEDLSKMLEKLGVTISIVPATAADGSWRVAISIESDL